VDDHRVQETQLAQRLLVLLLDLPTVH
jgi:hypothetical protein